MTHDTEHVDVAIAPEAPAPDQPRTFTDRYDNRWLVEFDLWLLQRLKKELGVDLLDVLDKDNRTLATLFDDFERTGQILFMICEAQIREKGFQPEQFAAGFTGAVLAAAQDAIAEALCDFYRGPKARVLRATLNKTRAATDQAADEVVTQLNSPRVSEAIARGSRHAVTQAIDEALKETQTAGGDSSTSEPPLRVYPTSEA